MSSQDDAQPTLHCLMGHRPPADLADKLSTLLALPESVQKTYAEVLEPNLAEVIDDRTETRVKRYCRRHDIEPDLLLPSVMACRLLITNAVRACIDREAFIEDIETLLDEDRKVGVLALLMPLFDAAFPKMMQAALFRSIADHGKVVRHVHWRMNMVTASDHTLKLEIPVATLTLQYQEGPNSGQESYQLMPEQAIELRRALKHIVEDPIKSSR